MKVPKIEDILKNFNLKYEDLSREEKDTLYKWLEAVDSKKIDVAMIKGHVTAMRESVERELTVSKLGTKDDMYLKARLRNYLLLEAFLTSPEKAKEALERAIAGMIPKT